MDKKIKELEQKVNNQDDINKHINNKFRKVWDSINPELARLYRQNEELENRIKELENHRRVKYINNITKRFEKLERDIISIGEGEIGIKTESLFLDRFESMDWNNKAVDSSIEKLNNRLDELDNIYSIQSVKIDDLEAKNYQLKSDLDNNNKRLEELEDWYNDNKIKALKNHNMEGKYYSADEFYNYLCDEMSKLDTKNNKKGGK